jgi:hypothetical protein
VQATPTLLVCVERLKYSDHNVVDARKLPEFAQQVYMDIIGTGPFGDPMMQPKQWAASLENTGILNLVDISHFGRVKEVNNCVNKLIAVLHGGFLWMEEPISIDMELITFIIGMSSMDKTPMQYLNDNTKEKALAEEMKKTYSIERSSRRIIIKRINDVGTRMAIKLMACKLLRKCRKEEFPTGVVVDAAQCANGTMLSWAPNLLNLFLNDFKDVFGTGVYPGFNASIVHNQNPNYRPFQQHLQSR